MFGSGDLNDWAASGGSEPDATPSISADGSRVQFDPNVVWPDHTWRLPRPTPAATGAPPGLVPGFVGTDVPESEASPNDSYEHVLELPDGRKVGLYYAHGGLWEQRFLPAAGAWTYPRLIHASGEDRCQGIALVQRAGTVAAIADFGKYCYDRDPPQESLALVATGDLATWDVHVRQGFDGWAKATISADGSAVDFSFDPRGKHYLLQWRSGTFTQGW